MSSSNHRKTICTGPIMPPIVLDLFAGAGGLSEGLRQAGYKIAVANEFDASAAKTYRLNHPETVLIEGDITLKETKDAICACFVNQACDLLAAGVPCQPWSNAGKRQHFNDSRGLLWFHFMEMLQRLKPRMAIAENVPGLLSHPEAMKTILSIFNHLGYHSEYRVLNAADHGVPQVRKRLFFIATRRDWRNMPIIWPEPQFVPATGGNPTP